MKKGLVLITVLLTTMIMPSVWAKDSISVSDIVIREMLPGVKSTAGYLKISNHSDSKVVLKSVSSPLSSRIEIHEHTMTNGMMKMQQVKGDINIPAHGELVFQPGGYHLMVFNPGKKVKKGMTFDLQLVFADQPAVKGQGSVVSVLQLQDKAQKNSAQHGHHH
jgi:copper(I)-binding protein